MFIADYFPITAYPELFISLFNGLNSFVIYSTIILNFKLCRPMVKSVTYWRDRAMFDAKYEHIH